MTTPSTTVKALKIVSSKAKMTENATVGSWHFQQMSAQQINGINSDGEYNFAGHAVSVLPQGALGEMYRTADRRKG